MAKRFSDTDKWKKPFIRSLQAPYKLFWLYILDDCDHAGVWQVDMEIANIKLGENINKEIALSQFGDKILVIDNGEKWFIKDFIDFQYGELNPKNRVHESVISILKRYKIKPLISPFQGAKDKDKDMDKEKDKDLDKENSDFYISQISYLENLDRDIYEKLKTEYGITEPLIYKHTNQHPIEYYDLVQHLAEAIKDDAWKQSLITRFGLKYKFTKAMSDYFNLLKTNYEYLNFKDTYDFRKYFSNWFNTKKDNYK